MMKCCRLYYDKNIFTIYTGLIASGYNLMDEAMNKSLIESINRIEFERKVTDYFKQAKKTSCKVNPYWPRAFMLTLASFYITDDEKDCSKFQYYNFNEFIKKLTDLSNINAEEKSGDTITWLRDLPDILGLMKKCGETNVLWNDYIKALEKKQRIYDSIIEEAVGSVLKFFNVTEDKLPEIKIIPNELQAPQATDFAAVNDTLYIIKAVPDKESIIHEFLHYIFDSELDKNINQINKYMYLLKPVLNDMIKYQYAWDYSEVSWRRVFEESFMRAAAAYVNDFNDYESAERRADSYKNYGFIYVPLILECFESSWNGLDNLNEFIGKCLQKCSGI